MGERRRRWEAVGIAALTLAVTAMAGWVVLLGSAAVCWEGCSAGALAPIIIGLGGVAVCLVWGLVWAWRVGTGRARDPGRDRAGGSALLGSGPAWLVVEPGADFKESVLLDEVISHLEAGTAVWEVCRFAEAARVRLPEGREGWVDADRLEPAVAHRTGKGGGHG